MDIQKKEVLIAEIEQFKEEALKMHIVQVLADTYTNTSLFDYNIDSHGSVIWYKAQARQLWDFWQTSKAQVPEGFLLMPRKCTNKMAHAAKSVDGRLSAFKYADVYDAMVEAQEQSHENG